MEYVYGNNVFILWFVLSREVRTRPEIMSPETGAESTTVEEH